MGASGLAQWLLTLSLLWGFVGAQTDPPPAVNPDPPSDKVLRFTTWMEAHAGAPLPVEVRATTGMGLGLFATKDLPLGAVYAAVPAPLLIGRQTIRNSSRPVYLQRGIDQALALFLIHERAKGDASLWAPYIDLLPSAEAYLDLPKRWPEEDLSTLLRGTQALNVTREILAQEAAEYADLREFLETADPELLPHFTIEAYQWARDTREARSMLVEGTERFLIPLLDLANCKSHIKTRTLRRSFTGSAEGTTTWKVKAGQQVFENYGLTNGQYFQHHGFVLPTNPQDCYNLSLADLKEKVAQWDDVYARTRNIPDWTFCLVPNKPIPDTLLTILAAAKGKAKLLQKYAYRAADLRFADLLAALDAEPDVDPSAVFSEASDRRAKLADQYRSIERRLVDDLKKWFNSDRYKPKLVPRPHGEEL